jgi:hypothetical protein
MINKIALSQLRNLEHFQFITDADIIFRKHNLDPEYLTPSYAQLSECQKAEETALAIEKNNEKIREKNAADAYRDKSNSSLFNYLKSIIYDERDPRYDAASRLMAVLKSVGNPTQLAENTESAMLVTLGNRLETYHAELELTGARQHLDRLMEANRQFMDLEKECRAIAATNVLMKAPSMATVRKQTDPVYRKIVNSLNAFIGLKDKTAYTGLIADMNVLVDKYNKLLSQRGGKDSSADN